MIISKTPYRISFFGGGSDYPSWYLKHGGQVLATTIDKFCYITCRYLPPFFEHRIRVVYSQTEHCQSIDQIQHPAVRETLRFLKLYRGIEIHHDGDLPARSGMGTSSSYTVGLLHALYALMGKMPSKMQLAHEGIHIEQKILNETVGSQDQVLAAYGGLNHITFPMVGEIAVRPLTLSIERIHDLNDQLMLFYTGIERTASDVAASYVTNLENKERELKSIVDAVQEGISILNSDQPIRYFGELLDDVWQSKRKMSPNISNSSIDEIYNIALSEGATGGKLLGAGGGGFMLIFADPKIHSRIREKLSNLIYVPFRFETSGSQIIFHDREFDYSAHEQTVQ